MTARFVRYVHGHVGAATLAISDIRLFGNAGGVVPMTPRVAAATRASDDRDATIRWSAARGATGYNVLWGVRPDRLTLCYQKFADQLADPANPSLDLRSLNHGVAYFVAVEAFNDSGVSRRSPVRAIRR
ncbi:MAG: fibronectin type III domain-containing protein [Pseudomonadota bacterium]|nr:fibronectin type III domain-containing protein [Pseudomonadota bacterium]